MISGFTSTILASGFFPPVTSTTASRRLFPICGAANPTPCAAYIEANISSASCSSSASNSLTGAPGFSRMGSPYLTIGQILGAGDVTWDVSAAPPLAGSELVNLSGIVVKIPPHLRERVSPKFLQKSIRQHKCDHGFPGDCPGRHHAPIRPLVRRLHRLLRHHVCRVQRLPQRRNRFQVPANHHVFTVRDPAF